MAGSAIKLAGAVTSSPFGKFHNYEGTWDSTMFLWDAGYAPLAAVPANGATLTNLLRDQCAAVSGQTLANCDFVVTNQAGSFLANELTSKGGIHTASTQAGSQNAAASFELTPSTAFANWLLTQTDAGADYAVMMTAWARPTRAQLSAAAPQPFQMFTASVSPGTNYHSVGPVSANVAGGVVISGNGLPMSNTPGTPQVAALVSNGWAGTKPGSGAAALVPWNVGAAWGYAGGNYNKAPSAALYRVQLDLVDLSDIAGASVAAKTSAMIAVHQAMLARDFAAGGRFYGDTYTAASTLKA